MVLLGLTGFYWFFYGTLKKNIQFITWIETAIQLSTKLKQKKRKKEKTEERNGYRFSKRPTENIKKRSRHLGINITFCHNKETARKHICCCLKQKKRSFLFVCSFVCFFSLSFVGPSIISIE